MNLNARFFIGFAIAVVFPIFAYFAAVTVVPARETSAGLLPPELVTVPEEPDYDQRCRVFLPVSSVTPAPNRTQAQSDSQDYTNCYRSLQAEYERAQARYESDIAQYDSAQKAYDASVAAARDASERRNVYRQGVMLGIGILGLIIIMLVAARVVAYGVGVGVGAVLFLGTTQMLITAAGLSDSDVYGRSFAAIVLAVTFLLIAGLALLAERRLPAIMSRFEPALVEPTPSSPVVPAVTMPEPSDKYADGSLSHDIAPTHAVQKSEGVKASTSGQESGYAVGDEVSHSEYGSGIVSAVEGKVLMVVFSGLGAKDVLAQDERLRHRA